MHYPPTHTLPPSQVVQCVLEDFDVVYAPTLASYGSCPASLQHCPGTRVQVGGRAGPGVTARRLGAALLRQAGRPAGRHGAPCVPWLGGGGGHLLTRPPPSLPPPPLLSSFPPPPPPLPPLQVFITYLTAPLAERMHATEGGYDLLELQDIRLHVGCGLEQLARWARRQPTAAPQLVRLVWGRVERLGRGGAGQGYGPAHGSPAPSCRLQRRTRS
jgi:hypothetical protein